MKIQQVTSKEKIAIVVMFSIDFLSKLLSKMLEIGEMHQGVFLGLVKGLPLWSAYIIDIVILLVVWMVRKTMRFNKISRVGFVLMVAGSLCNVVWRILFGSLFLWIDIGYLANFSLSEVMILFGLILAFIGIIWDEIE
ncbi:MAG: hypothetical protein ABIC57_03465 [bacterium]